MSGRNVIGDSRRDLRRRQTRAEVALWELVRDRRLMGLRFRRQYVVAGFIADFYCNEARLIVELDGPHHDERGEADAHRDSIIPSLDITILRFNNADLNANPRAVLARIREAIKRTAAPLPHTISPVPRNQ